MADGGIQHQVDVDLIHLAAMGVPGAILGDYAAYGPTGIALAGLVSASAAEYATSGRSNEAKHLRNLFRTAPLLGLGVGYTAGRIGGMKPEAALLPGVIGAVVAAMCYQKMNKLQMVKKNTSEAYNSVPAYATFAAGGGPPAAAPAAQNPSISPY